MRIFLLCIMLILSVPAHAQNAGQVLQYVQAACSCNVTVVSIGDPNDKATWTITFGNGVTDQQKATAQSAMAAYTVPPSSMQVTSTLFPSLNGTYAIDARTQQNVQAISLYISVNGNFPAGLSAMPFFDINGTPHNFPTTDEWQAFATAMGDFVTKLALGQSVSQPVAIP